MSCKKAPPSFTVGGKKNKKSILLHFTFERGKKSFKMNAMGKDFSQ